MFRSISTALVLIALSVNMSFVFAQEAELPVEPQEEVQAEATPVDGGPRPETQTVGNIQCFDYYTFGSLDTAIEASNKETVPGATITFSGTVTNQNPYPVVDGDLWVKIFREDESTMENNNGNPIVDQFKVRDAMLLKANEAQTIQYEWKVPLNARAGSYYAAYYFTTNDQYSLAGLLFSDDVIGGRSSFMLSGETEMGIAELQKNGTTLNGEPYQHVAFPPIFEKNDPVKVSANISNPTDKEKRIPVQWNQYAWDGQKEGNLRNVKTELVVLAPGETKAVTYDAVGQPETVTFITATAQDLESRSILNFRFARSGLTEAKTAFTGLNKFPVPAGEEAMFFTCAHTVSTEGAFVGVSPAMGEKNIYDITLRVKTLGGEVLHEQTFNVPLTGTVAGFGLPYAPEAGLDAVVVESVLALHGNVLETNTVTYDCAALDPTTCFSKGGSASSLFTYMKLFLIALLVIVLGVLGYLFMKNRKRQGPNIVAVLALCLLSAATLFPGVSEGKTDTAFGFTSSPTHPLLPTYMNDNGLAVDYNVTYEVNIRNLTTNTLMTDGETIPTGTIIRIEPRPRSATGNTTTDISWSSSGGFMGTPYGFWNAPSVANRCHTSVGIGDNNAFCPGLDRTEVYTNFSVPLLAEEFDLSGVATTNLGSNEYRIESGGTLTVNVKFPLANGLFRIYYKEDQNTCSVPGYGPCIDAGGSMFAAVPEINIPFTFTVSPSGDGVAVGESVPVAQPSTVFDFPTEPDFGLYGNNWSQTKCTSGVCDGGSIGVFPNIFTMTPSDACDYAISVSGLPAGTEKTCSYEKYSAALNSSCIMVVGVCSNIDFAKQPMAWVKVYEGSPATQTTCNRYEGDGTMFDTVYYMVDEECAVVSYPATPTNTPPSAPVITGPTTGTVGTYGFSFVSTDPELNAIRYAIDWDSNGAEDQSVPGAGFVPSGTSQNANQALPVGTTTFQVKAIDDQGVNSDSPWSVHQIVLTPVPPPTASLTINGSDGPLTVNNGAALTISWSSTGASSCAAAGAGWSGPVALSGSVVVPASVAGNYILTCTNGVDSSSEPPVFVDVNTAPTMHSVLGVTTAYIGQNVTWTFQATDPDAGDSLYYEIDWDNNGSFEDIRGPFASGYFYDDTRTWPADQIYTIKVRARDTKNNAYSNEVTKSIDIDTPPPPTASMQVAINGGGPVSGDQTINPTDTLRMYWNSTDASTCDAIAGGGFSTGGSAGPASDPVSTPTPGTAETFTVRCTGLGGTINASITITVRALPNFTEPTSGTATLSGFDPVTRTFSSITVPFSTTNGGGSDTLTNANYRFQFDKSANGSWDATNNGSIGLLTAGSGFSTSEIVSGGIPLGPNRYEVFVDSTNAVAEGNEGDNTRVFDINVEPPDPLVNLTVAPSQVQNGANTVVSWNAPLPTYAMNCSLYGPGMTTHTFNLETAPTGSRTAGPLTAKSVYTLSCTEAASGKTYTYSREVITQGVIEEI
jgi:hypothetical protein